jgi:hypothetical protein
MLLPFRDSKGDPGGSIHLRERKKMMRLEQLSSHWNHHVAKLKQEFLDIRNGIVQAVIEEEMKIRREEIDSRVGSANRRQESRGT